MLYRHPDFQYIYKRPWLIKKAYLSQKGFFRRLAYASSATLLLASLAVLNMLLLPKAGASYVYNASNVLGQTDYSNNPTYTNNYENNVKPANLIGYDLPGGTALDTANHRLFVADSNNNRVMIYNLNNSNQFTGEAASNEIGQPNFPGLAYTAGNCEQGIQSSPSQSTLCMPKGVAYDSASKHLFVQDAGWNRVMIYDLSGGITNGMSAVNVIGRPNFTSGTGACGSATQSKLCMNSGTVSGYTTDLSYDSANQRLFVGDTAFNREMIFDLSGGLSNGMNASWVLGQSVFTTSSSAITQSGLNHPGYSFYDSGNKRLYVSDVFNNRVMAYDLSSGISSGMNASWVLGQSGYTTGTCPATLTAATACGASGIDWDSGNSRLFVGNSNRVTVFDLSGGLSSNMNASWVLGPSGFGGNGQCSGPSQSNICPDGGVIYDSTNQQLLVADNYYRVMVFNLSGGIINGMNASNEVGQTDYSGNIRYDFNAIDNGNLSPVGMSNPYDVKVDQVHHRLFVTDFTNGRVLIYNLDSNNNLTSNVADYELGQPDFTKNTDPNCIPETQSTICWTEGLAIDTVHDRLFVTDDFYMRVLVFDLSGGITNGMNASYVLGAPDFTTPNDDCSSAITGAKMCQPSGLAYDSADNWLYISDESNNRVLTFNVDPTTMVSGESAVHVLGQSNFTTGTQNCSGGSGLTNHTFCFLDLNDLQGLVYDQTNKYLFVGDDGTSRVMIFNLSGGLVDGMSASWVLGQPNFTTGNNTCSMSTFGWGDGLAYDANSGRLFVSDDRYDRILEFNLKSGIINGMNANYVLGSPGTDGCSGNPNNISQSQLNSNEGLDYDPVNNKIYTAEIYNNRVTVFNVGPVFTNTTLADGVTGSAYSDSVATQDVVGSQTLTITNGSLPSGVSIDSGTGALSGTPTANGVYNFTVQVIDQIGETNSQTYSITVGTTYRASNLLGQIDGSDQPIWDQSAANDNSVSTNAQGMEFPEGTTVDDVHHKLFVADEGNNRVLVYNLDSNNDLIDHTADNVLGQPDMSSSGQNDTQNGLGSTAGVAYDSSDNYLFVSDWLYNRVMVYDLSGGISNGMNASWVLGQSGFTAGTCNNGQSGLCIPGNGLVYDPTSHFFYVADSNNHRVMVYDLSGGISNGMNASYELGNPNFTTYANSGDLPTQSNVVSIEGLALDTANHHLFVADWNFAGRVMVFDTSSLSNGMNASNELGETDFTSSNSASDNGGTPDAKSFGPIGLAFDSNDKRLFVDDGNDSRSLVFDVSTIVNDENAVGLLGQPTFTNNDTSCTTNQGTLCDPSGYSDYYDSTTNRLYLSDTDNNRVMIYDFARLAFPAPDGTVGTAYSYDTDAHHQGSVTFSLISGSLPSGLGLDAATGLLSGTPTANGMYNFNLRIQDNNGPSGSWNNDHGYNVTIASASGGGGGGNTGGGSSGGNQGGNSQGGSHSSGSGSSSTPAPPASPGPPVNLDNQPGISGSGGYTTTAVDGQTFTFTDSSGGDHTITVGPIGSSSTGLDIDSGSTSVDTGQKLSKDVNDDGKGDIDITLNSITGGTANLTFHKIIFAIAPGGNTSNNGSGAGSPASLAKPQGFWFGLLHHIPKIVLLVFPWLLFILLGASVARLSWLAIQERRLAGKLAEQLAHEKSLSEQKNNFVTLASHYLRTPVSTIAGGIELLASLSGNPPAGQAGAELKDLSAQLSSGVNDLLYQVEHRAPAETEAPKAGMVLQAPLQALTAGFIQLSSLRGIVTALLGAFGLIGVTDYILAHVDLYNVGLVHLLEQLAGILLLGILLYASLRSYHRRKELRVQAQKLLASQRELDSARNTLIKNSLANLAPVLGELKARFRNLGLASPQAKPALDGIAQLDALLAKFTIAASLEARSMGRAAQTLELNQLVGNSISRYTNAIQSKFLAVKNEVEPATLSQDPLLLSFVVDSLLANAIKYSPNNGEIRIEGKLTGHGVELSVEDHGPGIPAEKQAQLFAPFSRAENTAADFNTQGVGLSLYLDKLVMGYLGGDISLDSQAGRGATVSLSL